MGCFVVERAPALHCKLTKGDSFLVSTTSKEHPIEPTIKTHLTPTLADSPPQYREFPGSADSTEHASDTTSHVLVLNTTAEHLVH